MTHSGEETTEVVERFRPTAGRFMGPVGVVLGLGLCVAAALEVPEISVTVPTLGLLLAALSWASMIRPGFWITREHAVVRNMFTTAYVPLAAVESFQMRQVLVLFAGERRFAAAAIGRSRRKVVRDGDKLTPDKTHPDEMEYIQYIADRLQENLEKARTERGVRVASDAQMALAAEARREVDPISVVVVGVAVLAFVVSFFL